MSAPEHRTKHTCLALFIFRNISVPKTKQRKQKKRAKTISNGNTAYWQDRGIAEF